MADLFLSCRKLLLGSSVDDVSLCTEAEGCSCRIHGDIAAAHDDALLRPHDRGPCGLLIPGAHQVGSCQELVCGEDAECLLALDAHEPRKAGTGADKHRVKPLFVHQLVDGDGSSDDNVGLDLYAKALDVPDLLGNDLLLRQTELRDAVDENAARLVQGLEDRDVIAELCQVSCTGKAGRACADDGDLFAVLCLGRLGADAELLCLVGNVALELSDGNGLALDAADALCLALALLGADSAADRGKARGLGDHLIGLCHIAVLHLLDEGRDVDRDRTPLHAEGIFAVEASGCLCLCLFIIISQADLFKVGRPYLRILLANRNFFHHIHADRHRNRSFLTGTRRSVPHASPSPVPSGEVFPLRSCRDGSAAWPGQSRSPRR